MSVEKLERVLWRVRQKNKQTYINWIELKRAIMMEIGTDERTYYKNKRALRDLDWIRTEGKTKFFLTDKHLE